MIAVRQTNNPNQILVTPWRTPMVFTSVQEAVKFVHSRSEHEHQLADYFQLIRRSSEIAMDIYHLYNMQHLHPDEGETFEYTGMTNRINRPRTDSDLWITAYEIASQYDGPPDFVEYIRCGKLYRRLVRERDTCPNNETLRYELRQACAHYKEEASNPLDIVCTKEILTKGEPTEMRHLRQCKDIAVDIAICFSESNMPVSPQLRDLLIEIEKTDMQYTDMHLKPKGIRLMGSLLQRIALKYGNDQLNEIKQEIIELVGLSIEQQRSGILN